MVEEIYDEGIINKKKYKVVYNPEINQYVFTVGDEEQVFHDVHTLNKFLDRLDSLTNVYWRSHK